jgi:acyl-CoA synthetase (AMP-forming)/AMP-acid ligase II
MNIVDILEKHAADRPGQPAIIDWRGSRERTHSFLDLAGDAARAASLLAQHRIGKSDVVVVFQPMSYELYVNLFALFRLGAIAMFVDPSTGRSHIERCCAVAKPKGLIASPKAHWLRLISPALRSIEQKFVSGSYFPGAISLETAIRFSPKEQIASTEEELPALLTFTSGSMGVPKAALRSHDFLLSQHLALERTLALRPGEIDLTTLPIFLLANLASGVSSVIPKADLRYPGQVAPGPVIEQIKRSGIVRSAASPAFFNRLAEHCEQSGETLPSLARIDTGGAPVFPPLLVRLQRMAPHAEIVAVYGSTEAEPIAHMAFAEMRETDIVAMRQGKGLLAGKPVTEVQVRVIRDRFGEPIGPFSAERFEAEILPVYSVGEIVVSGTHVLKGYLHGAGDEETKFEVEGNRWHRTGDAGYFDTEGRLWLVGRCAARVADTRGVLYPFTVECAAQFALGVKRCAMVSHLGRRLLLVERIGVPDLEEIGRLLEWAQLDEILTVTKIPVDNRHNAKVDYTRIRDLLKARH